jgi:hypothetical protein
MSYAAGNQYFFNIIFHYYIFHAFSDWRALSPNEAHV